MVDKDALAEIILWMRPANERRRYIVMSSLIHKMVPALCVSKPANPV